MTSHKAIQAYTSGQFNNIYLVIRAVNPQMSCALLTPLSSESGYQGFKVGRS